MNQSQKKTTRENFEVSISKEELSQLPIEKYEGEIIIVETNNELAEAFKELRKADIIGFDTETRPTFQKGQINKVALLQLATLNKCYLIRLFKTGIPKEIIDFLEDDSIPKVGLSIKDDFHSLSKLAQISPKGFTDLQDYVKNFKISDSALTKIYGIVFGKRISKSQQLTNWEAPSLTIRQREYAALDALACIKLYNFLKEGKFQPENSPYYKLKCTEKEN